MQTRRLGNTDLHLTTIGLGTWAMGGHWAYGWGKQADRESIAAIHRGIDLGINWIDTAAVYGYGRSAMVVGQTLAGRRDQVILATKFGRLPCDGGTNIYSNRNKNPHFQEPALGATLDLVDELRPIAADNGKTVAQLAIAWTLRRPEVTSAIVGAGRPSQIEETAQAGDWTLSDKEIKKLKRC